MFDPESFFVGGVSLIALVFGLTEFLKTLLGWSGSKVTVLAASIGAVVMILYKLIGFVAEPYGTIVEIVFVSIAFGLSASGFYKFTSSRLAAQKK